MTPDNALTHFFEYEVADYRENVRNGNIDPADGFHPTLASAADSFMQAPHDMRAGLLGLDDIEIDAITDALIELALLIAEHGPNKALIDFTEAQP